MNKKSKKRLYNKRNKTLKRKKTSVARGLGSVTINLQRITNFDDLTKNYELYFVKKVDDDEDNEYNDIDEYIGSISSTSIENKSITFEPCMYRQYKVSRGMYDSEHYRNWGKTRGNYTWPFDDIEVYSCS
uniref:Uncharacterized protein n=1 Tax=viral metagenome TaxID=1070528 RepID=A0A6C0JIH7_9ZZZZ